MIGTQQINTIILPANNRRIYPDEITTVKSSLLNPSEVTFHDSDLIPKRKRLTTISSETTEWESHASTSTLNTTKKKPKIPDGGYGWWVSFRVE